MNCIKCGVTIPENQVFCDACLADMEKYPVKPDITVSLPHREEAPVSKKKSRRQRTLPVEEQLRRAKTKPLFCRIPAMSLPLSAWRGTITSFSLGNAFFNSI